MTGTDTAGRIVLLGVQLDGWCVVSLLLSLAPIRLAKGICASLFSRHLKLRSVWFMVLLTDNCADFTAFPWCPLVSSVPTVPPPLFILLSSAQFPHSTPHPSPSFLLPFSALWPGPQPVTHLSMHWNCSSSIDLCLLFFFFPCKLRL